MTITCEQLDTLQQIQRCVLMSANAIDYTIYHDVIAWDWGDLVSNVRVANNDGEYLLESRAAVTYGDDTVPAYDTMRGRMTLAEQYSVLAEFVAKQEVAA